MQQTGCCWVASDPMVVDKSRFHQLCPGVGRNRHPAIFSSFGLTSKSSMIHILVPQLGASPERVLIVSEAGGPREVPLFFYLSPPPPKLLPFHLRPPSRRPHSP